MLETAARLSEREIETYRRDGYVAKEGILDRREIEEARDTIDLLIARMHEAALARSPDVEVGRDEGASSNYAGLELRKIGSRLVVRFEAGTDPFAMTREQALRSVRVLYGYRDEHPIFNAVAAHPRILSVVESIVGAGPVLFQDMALVKPPFIGSEKPWHQDDAYFSWAPLEKIVGVWVALDEARAENGCMHVIPGGHRNSGLRHWHSALDCEIVQGRVDASRAVPVELAPGGALFFSGLLPHQTPVNRSPQSRRALQLHYRGADTHKLEPEEYDQVFVDPDGAPASCRAARKT